MENQFIRHEPCFERILFVLTLDRKKMKERILIGVMKLIVGTIV